MGRTRKPVEAHLIAGTYRADRHGPLRDEPASFAPPAKPDGMLSTAAQFWDEVVALLAGIVRDRDGPQLEQMCNWWALWQEASNALIDAEIGTIEYVRTLNAATIASQNFDRIAKRFGLTPADRAAMRAEVAAGPGKPKVATRPTTRLDQAGSPKAKAKPKGKR